MAKQVCLDDGKTISQPVGALKSCPTFFRNFPPLKKSYRDCVVIGSFAEDVEELEPSTSYIPLKPKMWKNDKNTSDEEKEYEITKPNSPTSAKFA